MLIITGFLFIIYDLSILRCYWIIIDIFSQESKGLISSYKSHCGWWRYKDIDSLSWAKVFICAQITIEKSVGQYSPNYWQAGFFTPSWNPRAKVTFLHFSFETSTKWYMVMCTMISSLHIKACPDCMIKSILLQHFDVKVCILILNHVQMNLQ